MMAQYGSGLGRRQILVPRYAWLFSNVLKWVMLDATTAERMWMEARAQFLAASCVVAAVAAPSVRRSVSRLAQGAKVISGCEGLYGSY
jgi:hypothetical protein